MDMNLSKLQEMVRDREAWLAALRVRLQRFPALRKKCVLKSSPKPPWPGRKGNGVYRCSPPAQ